MNQPTPSFNPLLPGHKDRRNFPRRRPRGTASFVPAAKPMAPSSTITPVNISQGGVSFLASKPLEIGERILIDLLAPGYGKPMTLQAEVRWVGPSVKTGKHLIGCSWTQRIPYADLIRFF